MPNLKVKRTYHPIDTWSQWEQRPYDAVIWEWEDGSVAFSNPATPKGYAPGLLRCFVDDVAVDTEAFDVELHKIGWTRKKIMP